MNRKEAAELLPIIQALAEGKVIECRAKIGRLKGVVDIPNEWTETNEIWCVNSLEYRIKPEQEPKYRPFKNAEECWQEMLKHQPFGWLKYKKYPYFALITTIHSGNTVSLNGKEGWDFLHIMNDYVFADNIPFGVKVEE